MGPWEVGISSSLWTLYKCDTWGCQMHQTGRGKMAALTVHSEGPHIGCVLPAFFIIKVFHLFYISTTVFPPSSLPIPFPHLPLNPLPETSTPPLFRKGWASHGSQQSLPYQVEAGPSSSPCIKAQGWVRHPSMGNRFQKASSCARGRPSYTTVTHLQRAYLNPMQAP